VREGQRRGGKESRGRSRSLSSPCLEQDIIIGPFSST
jgi:hypothetical protein